MKERGIIFSGEMVRAILDGRKTQTRRIVKPQPDKEFEGEPYWNIGGFRLRIDADGWPQRSNPLHSPFGYEDDRLWVRETWAIAGNEDGHPETEDRKLCPEKEAYRFYRADCSLSEYGMWKLPNGTLYDGPWRSPIHMPRWASRITLEITGVRVERLNEISDSDCEAEGVRPSLDGNAKDWRPDETGWQRTYRQLWERISGAGSWDLNPWVWVIEFNRVP